MTLASPVGARVPPAWSREAGLSRLEGSFADASARAGVVERWYRIGGWPIRIRFAGSALLPAVDRAIAHLSAPAAARPALDIGAWDSMSTGVSVPKAPDGVGSGLDRRIIHSAFHQVPSILSLYDPVAARAVVWVPDAGAVPSNEAASPLRTVLHWWTRDQGLQFVHGGAVARAGRAALVCGPSGAGKSTTTLACLLDGMDYLGDDYVLVRGTPRAEVHSLYSAAKLQPEQVAAFPDLEPYLANATELPAEKALWFVHERFPERLPASARAVAVLVPRVTGRTRSTVSPIRPGTALAALAPSTIVQLSGADQGSLTAIAAFLTRLPSYRLEAGTDRRGLAAAVGSVIDGVGSVDP